MRVIDFVGLGAEHVIYIISDDGTPVLWRGTRQDFVRELSAFFLLFYRTVTYFDIGEDGAVILHI